MAQLSRSVEQRGGDKRPILSDLRESGAIEQDADIVSFIYRPEYYGLEDHESEESNYGLAEIIIAKHRSDAQGKIKLRFISEYARFDNINEVPEHEKGNHDLRTNSISKESGTYTIPSKMNKSGSPADKGDIDSSGVDQNAS